MYQCLTLRGSFLAIIVLTILKVSHTSGVKIIVLYVLLGMRHVRNSSCFLTFIVHNVSVWQFVLCSVVTANHQFSYCVFLNCFRFWYSCCCVHISGVATFCCQSQFRLAPLESQTSKLQLIYAFIRFIANNKPSVAVQM